MFAYWDYEVTTKCFERFHFGYFRLFCILSRSSDGSLVWKNVGTYQDGDILHLDDKFK